MKNKEIQSLTEQDIREKIEQNKTALYKLNLNHAVSPVDNPASIRNSRRLVARLVTELNKRKKATNK